MGHTLGWRTASINYAVMSYVRHSLTPYQPNTSDYSQIRHAYVPNTNSPQFKWNLARCMKKNHALFLSTLVDPAVDAGADLGAAGFLVVEAPTPFLIVPMTVLFVVAAGAAADVFLTTVPVLPSLESLTRLPVRVAGREGGLLAVVVLARLVLVGTGAEEFTGAEAFELAVEDANPRVGAPRPVFFAISTMLVNAERALLCCFAGDETGRPIWDLDGDDRGRSRMRDRVLDEVGDRI
ncbi:uncharacterized protein CTRU02_208827 [Colletotrichum truncatum]|uniref:Uncharacterized protein n=1 Tax=Colletotrichum truncatum TaxID=5467 RepID=A0ACC3YXJ9_COLTU